MAKVLEGPGMGLMKKWGIHVPNYVVVTSADELTKLGKVAPGSRVDMARTGIGMAVRAGAPRPTFQVRRRPEEGAAGGEDRRLFDRPERRLSRGAVRPFGRRP